VVYCSLYVVCIQYSLAGQCNKDSIQGSLSRVYGLLITRVSLKINGGMWLLLYDQQSID